MLYRVGTPVQSPQTKSVDAAGKYEPTAQKLDSAQQLASEPKLDTTPKLHATSNCDTSQKLNACQVMFQPSNINLDNEKSGKLFHKIYSTPSPIPFLYILGPIKLAQQNNIPQPFQVLETVKNIPQATIGLKNRKSITTKSFQQPVAKQIRLSVPAQKVLQRDTAQRMQPKSLSKPVHEILPTHSRLDLNRKYDDRQEDVQTIVHAGVSGTRNTEESVLKNKVDGNAEDNCEDSDCLIVEDEGVTTKV